MAEEKKQINAVTNESKNAIIRASAYSLPDNPTARGMKPDQIRRQLYQAICGGEYSVLAELERVIKEANLALFYLLGKAETDLTNHNLAEDAHADIRAAITSAVTAHNQNEAAHADIRTAYQALFDQLDGKIDTKLAQHNVANDAHADLRITVRDNRTAFDGHATSESSHPYLIGRIDQNAEDIALASETANKADRVAEANRINLVNITAQVQGIGRTYSVDHFDKFLDLIRGDDAGHIVIQEDRNGDGIKEVYYITSSDLKTGDNILIEDQWVPDFWFSEQFNTDFVEPTFEYEGSVYGRWVRDENGNVIGTVHQLEPDYAIINESATSATVAAADAKESARNAVQSASEAKAHEQSAVAAAGDAQNSAAMSIEASEQASEHENAAKEYAQKAQASAKTAEELVAQNLDYRYANPLKGQETGVGIVSVGGVSPLSHVMAIKASSKNVIPFPYNFGGAGSVYQSNGITFTVGNDGGITVVGTATAAATFYLADRFGVPLEHGKTYAFTKDKNVFMAYDDYSGTGATYVSFANNTFTWDQKYRFLRMFIQVTEGETISRTIYPMAVEGSVPATEYVPWFDVAAAKITKHTKNLIDDVALYEKLGLTYDEEKRAWFGSPVSSTFFYNKAELSGRFTIQTEAYLVEGTAAMSPITFLVYYKDGSQDYCIGTQLTDKMATYSFTTDVGKTVDKIRWTYSSTGSFYIRKTMVTYADSASVYESGISEDALSIAADGTVEGVVSQAPNITLLSDKPNVVIECAYNRDVNKAFAELYQAMISMGGNV